MTKNERLRKLDGGSDTAKWAANRIRELESVAIKEAAFVLRERFEVGDVFAATSDRLRRSANRLADCAKKQD